MGTDPSRWCQTPTCLRIMSLIYVHILFIYQTLFIHGVRYQRPWYLVPRSKQGLEQGTLIERIRQITKKINKGKSLDQIADEMEIDSADLKPLWEAVLSEAPDYDEKKIMEKIFSLERKECSGSH